MEDKEVHKMLREGVISLKENMEKVFKFIIRGEERGQENCPIISLIVNYGIYVSYGIYLC